MSLPPVRLDIAEYVALSHALVAHVCELAGLRTLFIKGPGAAYTGLRKSGPSSDTDVLLRPEEVDELILALHPRGWVERPHDTADDVFPQHSRTLYNPRWMTDIDIHTYFPGFEAPAGEVFELLWEHRTPMPIAGHEVSIPDKPSGAVILALHLLRSPWLPGTDRKLDDLAARCADVDPDTLLGIATRGGGLAALRPFLEDRMGFDLKDLNVPAHSREWSLRTTGQTSAAIRLVELVDAPWRRKPGMLLRALLPSREALAAKDLSIAADEDSLWRVRWRRLLRSIREFRSTLRSYRQFREQMRERMR